jgi:hypothetical protein
MAVSSDHTAGVSEPAEIERRPSGPRRAARIPAEDLAETTITQRYFSSGEPVLSLSVTT